MATNATGFDTDAVRRAWDTAADAYVATQAAGGDWYRYEFLGPAQVAACGAVDGLRVLDVGCGNGYLARELAQRGARVTGVDLSPRMIGNARAIEAERPLGIGYDVLDAAEIAGRFPAASFEMAASCLALQDMPDPGAAFRAVAAVLRPGGRFVAAITHPCTDMPVRGWEREVNGQKRCLCIDRYFDRGAFEFTWRDRWGGFTTASLHVPLEDWFGWIAAAGFQLRGVREPRPTDEAIRANPHLADAARVPYYMIFDLAMPG